MEINGKKAVVIGGASGFGRASAEMLAAKGADVAILDREGSDGPEVAKGIAKRLLKSKLLIYKQHNPFRRLLAALKKK